jgi:hypothetical protein
VLTHDSYEGVVVTRPSPDFNGPLRVVGWDYVPCLLFWNPLAYFVANPRVVSVWLELYDPEEEVISTSHASSVEELPRALVMHRREVTYESCVYIRYLQEYFFTNGELQRPGADQFTSTL